MQKLSRFLVRKTDDFMQVLIALKNVVIFILTPTRIKRLSYDNEILRKSLRQSKVEISRTIYTLDMCIDMQENIPYPLRNQLESLREFHKNSLKNEV